MLAWIFDILLAHLLQIDWHISTLLFIVFLFSTVSFGTFTITQNLTDTTTMVEQGEDFWLTVVPVGVTASFSCSPSSAARPLFSPSCSLFLLSRPSFLFFGIIQLPLFLSMCCPDFCLTRKHCLDAFSWLALSSNTQDILFCLKMSQLWHYVPPISDQIV